MRTTDLGATVRLYRLDSASEGGGTETLYYGDLQHALRLAENQPAEIQQDLFIQTDNDVVGYLDLIGE